MTYALFITSTYYPTGGVGDLACFIEADTDEQAVGIAEQHFKTLATTGAWYTLPHAHLVKFPDLRIVEAWTWREDDSDQMQRCELPWWGGVRVPTLKGNNAT